MPFNNRIIFIPFANYELGNSDLITTSVKTDRILEWQKTRPEKRFQVVHYGHTNPRNNAIQGLANTPKETASIYIWANQIACDENNVDHSLVAVDRETGAALTVLNIPTLISRMIELGFTARGKKGNGIMIKIFVGESGRAHAGDDVHKSIAHQISVHLKERKFPRTIVCGYKYSLDASYPYSYLSKSDNPEDQAAAQALSNLGLTGKIAIAAYGTAAPRPMRAKDTHVYFAGGKRVNLQVVEGKNGGPKRLLIKVLPKGK